MFKKLISLLFIGLSLSVSSQEKIIEFYNSLKKTESVLEGVIPIVNQNNDEISIFIADTKKVYGYLLGSDFELKKKLGSDDRDRKYKIPIGNSLSTNNDYRVYLSNKKLNEFVSINFSYENNNSRITKLDLKLEDEMFVQTITYNNKFYLMTIVKDSSIINVYSFNDDAEYVKNIIDLSKEKFTNRKNKEISLYKLLSKAGSNNSVKITENNPNSLGITTVLSKVYLIGNKVILSFDQNRDYTQIITIDLNTFENKYKKFTKPFNDTKPSLKNTNSFIKDDYIYIIGATKNKLTFLIKDFKTKTLVKEYSTRLNDLILFKNTPILAVSSNIYGILYVESNKTKKYLKDLVAKDIGVSVYKINNLYQISLGCNEPLKLNAIQTLMGLNKIEAFSSYTNSKLVYIQGLFDANFNHVEGDVFKNVFDKIINFKNERDYSAKGKKVFKYKDFYIFGNYYYNSKKYILRKFKE